MRLADQGRSYRDISRELDVPKSTLIQVLKRRGYDKKKSGSSLTKSWIGVVPYGFIVLGGRLVEDPKEQETVRLIRKYWEQGQAYREIARTLNRHGLKTRNGMEWKHQTIRSIILRQETDSGAKQALIKGTG